MRKQKTPNQNSKKREKNEDSLKGLWNIKHTNICIIGVPEREERAQRIENLFEKIMSKNFPNFLTYKSRKYRVPNKMNPKRPTPTHIITKMLRVKDKERILKTTRERQLPTRKIP